MILVTCSQPVVSGALREGEELAGRQHTLTVALKFATKGQKNNGTCPSVSAASCVGCRLTVSTEQQILSKEADELTESERSQQHKFMER